MSLRLELGSAFSGQSLVLAVEEGMMSMDGSAYRRPTGWKYLRAAAGRYAGEVALDSGILYPRSLVPPEEERLHEHIGSVAVYEEMGCETLILEVSRFNKKYKDSLEKVNGGVFSASRGVLTAVESARRLLRKVPVPGIASKGRVTYDDNIFVELNPARSGSSLEFHVNALHHKYGGGVVKSMYDAHFQDVLPNFEALCADICRWLSIPIRETLDTLYRER
jgi:hypothetical protein